MKILYVYEPRSQEAEKPHAYTVRAIVPACCNCPLRRCQDYVSTSPERQLGLRSKIEIETSSVKCSGLVGTLPKPSILPLGLHLLPVIARMSEQSRSVKSSLLLWALLQWKPLPM